MRTLPIGLLALLAAAAVGYFAARHFSEPPAAAPEEAPRQAPVAPVASPGRGMVEGEVENPRPKSGVAIRWIEKNNAARELLGQGRIAEAVALFEECHAAEPGSDVFRRNLAEALARLATKVKDEEGDLEAGIDQLRRATGLAPEREDLVRLLARWEKELELEADHRLEGGAYFDISFDVGRRDLLHNSEDVRDVLEEAYALLRGWFGVDPVIDYKRPPFKVVLYDRQDFDSLTGLGDWAGGVFDGVIRVSVEDLATERDRLRRILTHELVHAFVREVGGRDVPGWLNEGLAQLLEEEPPRVEKRVELARRRLRGAELFSLERLQDSLATWSDSEEIARAYAQSLAFVDFLEKNFGAGELRKLLEGCKAGEDVDATFRERNGHGLDVYLGDLQRELGE